MLMPTLMPMLILILMSMLMLFATNPMLACIIVLHVCWRRTYHSCGNHWAPDHAFDWCLATGNPLHNCNCTNCTWGTFASMVGGTISRLWEQLTWTITSFMSPVQEMVSGASAKIRLKFLMNCFWGRAVCNMAMMFLRGEQCVTWPWCAKTAGVQVTWIGWLRILTIHSWQRNLWLGCRETPMQTDRSHWYEHILNGLWALCLSICPHAHTQIEKLSNYPCCELLDSLISWTVFKSLSLFVIPQWNMCIHQPVKELCHVWGE